MIMMMIIFVERKDASSHVRKQALSYDDEIFIPVIRDKKKSHFPFWAEKEKRVLIYFSDGIVEIYSSALCISYVIE